MTLDYLKGYRDGKMDGLLRAAQEVEGHWNHSETKVNQHDQAIRSSQVLKQMAYDVRDGLAPFAPQPPAAHPEES